MPNSCYFTQHACMAFGQASNTSMCLSVCGSALPAHLLCALPPGITQCGEGRQAGRPSGVEKMTDRDRHDTWEDPKGTGTGQNCVYKALTLEKPCPCLVWCVYGMVCVFSNMHGMAWWCYLLWEAETAGGGIWHLPPSLSLISSHASPFPLSLSI